MTVSEYRKKYGKDPKLVTPEELKEELSWCCNSFIFEPWRKQEVGHAGWERNHQYLMFPYLWEDEGTCFRHRDDFFVCRDNGEYFRKAKQETLGALHL